MKNNFIERAKEKFPDFDYSKTEYKNSKTKVEIICPIHGKFSILPNNFLKSKFGCPNCGKADRGVKLRRKNFVQRAKEKFPFFDYSKVNYINDRTKVCIVCPEHGEFNVTPQSFLISKHGCPNCAIENRSKLRTMPFYQFVEKANQKHNNKYIYHEDTYINTRQKTLITCPIHGDFWQSATNHLSGDNCPLCAKENRIKLESLTTEQFIESAIITHGDKYDYSKVEYINNRTPVEIICKKHGSFWQRPDAHLLGKGCQLCKNSKGEQQVINFLTNKNINFKYQYRININQLARKTTYVIVDFYFLENGTQYIIEYHGQQHYTYMPIWHKTEVEFLEQQNRDNALRDYCKENNIKLIEIKYNENVSERLDSIFKNLK